jgi:Ca2+-binding RTX toxin-like protein
MMENLEERLVLSATSPVLTMAPMQVVLPDNPHTLPFLAQFEDVLETPLAPSTYSYTINWGDGSAIQNGTIDPMGDPEDPNNEFPSVAMGTLVGTPVTGRVKGTHAFELPDGESSHTYNVIVTLTETDDSGDPPNVVVGSTSVVVYPLFESTDGPGSTIGLETVPAITFEEVEVTVTPFFPSDVTDGMISGWTISWGDETETINGNPSEFKHVYADSFGQFDSGQMIFDIRAVAHTTIGSFGTLSTQQFVFEDSKANHDGHFDNVVTVVGDDQVGIDETYTIDLSYDDIGIERAVGWQIIWDTFGNPFDFSTILGDSVTASHAYSEAGEYVINIIATNDEGAGAFVTKTVSVESVASLPVADAGGPYITFADTPITLTGAGANGSGLVFEWDLDDDDVFGEAGEVGESVVFDPAGVAGMRTVKLRVTDENDVVSEISEATIEVLADGALVIDNELIVVGDSVAGDTVLVSLDGTTLSIETADGTTTFDATTFGDIRIRTGAGNDVVVIDASITNTVYIDGGDGNDLLVGGGGRSIFDGGAGNDFLYGAAGDDILMGGTGNDQIFGGGGNDSVVGGDGNDIVSGGAGFDLLIGSDDNDLVLGGGGEDILIGGTTIHDGDAAALDLIMATWTNGASFNARINALTGSGGLLQAGSAVFDDDDLDILIGGGGRDLVFGDTNPFDGAFDLIALSFAQDRLIAVN